MPYAEELDSHGFADLKHSAVFIPGSDLGNIRCFGRSSVCVFSSMERAASWFLLVNESPKIFSSFNCVNKIIESKGCFVKVSGVFVTLLTSISGLWSTFIRLWSDLQSQRLHIRMPSQAERSAPTSLYFMTMLLRPWTYIQLSKPPSISQAF